MLLVKRFSSVSRSAETILHPQVPCINCSLKLPIKNNQKYSATVTGHNFTKTTNVTNNIKSFEKNKR